MKSAVINASDISHRSGFSCWSANRWCNGECHKARTALDAKENRRQRRRAYATWCPIWEAGDCSASLPVRTRGILLIVDDTGYKEAAELLRDAGYKVKLFLGREGKDG